MSNNAISRTGTYTTYSSSGSAGDSGIYEYAGTSGISGVDYYSNDDLKNGSIFTDIDNKISIKFTQEVDNSSVKTFNKDIELPVAYQNVIGTIGLTHVVTGTTGNVADDNNLQSLKLTSLPETAYTNIAIDEFVEMSSLAKTDDNITYEFTPKANLSSNTTYFLKIDNDALVDWTGSKISYNTEKGFVTDNTMSFVTTNDYYNGFSMQVEPASLLGTEIGPVSANDAHPQFESGDDMRLYRANGTISASTVLKIQSIDGTKLTYQLEPDSYNMNVTYTATNPIVITSINHHLIDNDKIEIYDVVSGNAVTIGEYTITEITSDTFSIPVDGRASDAGGLNYYRNVNKNDLLMWSKSANSASNTYTIRKKSLSVSQKNSINGLDNLMNKTFYTIKDSGPTSSSAKGNLIKFNNSTLSYVPIDSEAKITTDSFVNNSIVDISTSLTQNTYTRFHIKANTSPEHNVHPFHSSAPKVISTFPENGGSFPRKLTITQITRKGAIALVSTNHPHNLSTGSFIKIVGSTQSIYNTTKTVLYVPSSNTFQYDMGSTSNFSGVQSPAPGNPKLQISNDNGATYDERFNSIFINFSQSMNTSTIIVANSTHLISANGSTGDFVTSNSWAYLQDSSSSTIQLSDSGFEDIESCVSIVASAGNSVFAVIPEILKREHRYKIKATTSIQDLGKTNSLYEFTTTEGIATGLVVRDPITGKEVIYSKDEDPPEIKKIFGSSDFGASGFAGKVFESGTLSEITSPDDYQSVPINFNGESLVIQFSESMNINSITSATTSTVPTGTVQLSSDNYNTVVQMSSIPRVSSTDEDNDTFKFTPVANLSANTVYTLKVFKSVRDSSQEGNQMIADNVSSIKTFSIESNPPSSANYFVPGEIISGIITLTIKSNTGTITTGLTAGDTFLGTTSKGYGQILDAIEVDSAITSIRYTELPGQDGSIKSLVPGEECKVNSSVNFTIDNVAITDPAEGNVVSFTSGTKRILYRDNKKDNEFLAGTSSIERIVGRTSNGYAWTGSAGTAGLVGAGFKTASTAIVANVFFTNTDGSLVSTSGSIKNSINVQSNVIYTFNQTMDDESINFNAVDSAVRSGYNILLSYDSGFQNTIPLSTSFITSNNETVFEFQPAILSNTSLNLTQNKNLYAKVTQTAKNKGDMNLQNAFSTTLYYANTATNIDFKAVNASVYTADGQEIELEVGSALAVNMPSQSSVISKSTPIIIHFNEVPDVTSFALNSEIELGTAHDFSPGTTIAIGNGTLTPCGKFGTQIKIQLGASLSAGTRYFLRVGSTVGGTNEGGKSLTTNVTWFNSFTTAA